MDRFMIMTQELLFYDFQNPVSKASYSLNESEIMDVNLNKNGKLIVTCDNKGNIRYIKTDNHQQMHQVKQNESALTCIEFSNEGLLIAFGSDQGQVQVFDLKQNEIIFNIQEKYSEITQVKFPYQKDLLISTSSMGEIFLYSISQQQKVAFYQSPKKFNIRSLSCSRLQPDQFSVGDVDGGVACFDLNKKTLEPFWIKAHSNNCSMVKFSIIYQGILYSCGFDENFLVMDLNTKQVKQTHQMMFPITCFELIKTEESVLIGGYYGDLILYSLKENYVQLVYKHSQDRINKIIIINQKNIQDNIGSKNSQSLNSTYKLQETETKEKYNKQVQRARFQIIDFGYNNLNQKLSKSIFNKQQSQIFDNKLYIKQSIKEEINDLKIFMLKELEHQKNEIKKIIQETLIKK